ncbi:MAG: glutathione S-transferase family protein [Pseudomonadota bacterium]
MITVHGRANSSNVQKVLWALIELDLAYELVARGGAHGGLDDPAFRKLTPYGLVPVIEDGGFALAESHSIVRHLGRQGGNPTLWPSLPRPLARAEAVMDWTQATLWAGIRPPYVAVAREGMDRSDPSLAAQVQALVDPLMTLERLLGESGWLTGGSFGFADIPAAVAMSRLVWLVGRGALPPETQSWFDACSDREAFQRVVVVDG